MNNLKLNLLLLSITACSITFGQSSDLTQKACSNLGLNIKDCYLSLSSETVMPNETSKSIVVIPIIAEKEDDYLSLDSYILVVENATGKILSKYFESHETNNWTSDAIKLESITIDTAPYILNDYNRAFGIKVSYSGSSRMNPYSKETMSLFIEQEEKLTPILKKHNMYLYNGEWNDTCDGNFKKEKTIIIVSKEKTNGFSNLLFKSKITETTNIKKDGDCLESTKKSSSKEIFKYNGKAYIR